MKKLLIALGLAAGIWAQPVTTPSLTLTAPPPPSVTGLSLTRVGNPGNATYYYWVIAVFPGGNSAPAGPVVTINAPNTLSVSNYIRVNWNAVSGASTYVVLRTNSSVVPNGNCSCAVATGLTSPTVNDTGGALGSYTIASQGAASTVCGIDNITVATPTVNCSPYTFGSSPTGPAGGALTGTYPNPLIANLTTVGAVPYVSASGTLNQDQTANGQFFWDATNHRLGVGTASPSYAIDSSGLRVFNQTSVTGSTTAIIQNGAGQTGNLLEFKNNAGTNLAVVNSQGRYETTSAYYLGSIGSAGDTWSVVNGNTSMRSDNLVSWSSTTVATAAKDAALARNSAGVIEANNGTAGTLRDFMARQYKNTPVAVTSLQTCNAGNAGSRASVNDALAPAWGVAVANGGAAFASVVCNGTNWTVEGK